MKNITRHTGKLQILRRENNSINGNPRYFAQVDGFTFYTAPDSAHAYSLPNYDGQTVTVELGTYYGKTTLKGIRKGEV